MRDYYAERAPVYERVYRYPERQADLQTLSHLVSELLQANRSRLHSFDGIDAEQRQAEAQGVGGARREP